MQKHNVLNTMENAQRSNEWEALEVEESGQIKYETHIQSRKVHFSHYYQHTNIFRARNILSGRQFGVILLIETMR